MINTNSIYEYMPINLYSGYLKCVGCMYELFFYWLIGRVFGVGVR